MKIFQTIPTSEEAKQFFNRYAGTIRTLKQLRTPAQILSAITEFSVLYAIGFNSIEPLNPAIAHKVGFLTGILGTLLLEAVIRASTGKAIAEWLDKTNGNKTLRVILSFVAVLAVISSGWLSFKGSSDIAQAISEEPILETTLEQDSINEVLISDLEKTFSFDTANVVARYRSEIKAGASAYKAKIGAAKREKQNWRNRGKRENKSYASKIDEARLKIETLEAEREANKAKLESEMNKELAELHKIFKEDQKSQKSKYEADIASIEDGNQNLIDESEANVKATGKSFGWITIVCLFFFVLITWCDEIVKHHSEQKEVVLPSEFANRENSWLEIYKGFAVKTERWRRKLAARMTNHSHSDIELPYKTVFEVQQNYLLLEQALKVIQEQQKRSIGFHKEKESKKQFEEAEIIAKKRRALNPTFSGEKEQAFSKEKDFTLYNLCKRYAQYKNKYATAFQKLENCKEKGDKPNGNTLKSLNNSEMRMEEFQKKIINHCQQTGQEVNYQFFK